MVILYCRPKKKSALAALLVQQKRPAKCRKWDVVTGAVGRADTLTAARHRIRGTQLLQRTVYLGHGFASDYSSLFGTAARLWSGDRPENGYGININQCIFFREEVEDSYSPIYMYNNAKSIRNAVQQASKLRHASHKVSYLLHYCDYFRI